MTVPRKEERLPCELWVRRHCTGVLSRVLAAGRAEPQEGFEPSPSGWRPDALPGELLRRDSSPKGGEHPALCQLSYARRAEAQCAGGLEPPTSG